jgi:hypothetical protein
MAGDDGGDIQEPWLVMMGVLCYSGTMAGDDEGVIQEPWLVMMGVLFRNHGW